MMVSKLIIIPVLGHQNKGKSSFTGSGLFVLMSQCGNNNALAHHHVPCDRLLQKAYSSSMAVENVLPECHAFTNSYVKNNHQAWKILWPLGKKRKKSTINFQLSWPNQLGHCRRYYMVFPTFMSLCIFTFVFAGFNIFVFFVFILLDAFGFLVF